MKPTIDAQSAGSWCKTYRDHEKMTQRQMAKMLDTTRGVIGALERGRVRSRRVAKAVLELQVSKPEELI